jgi:hypothetical protein
MKSYFLEHIENVSSIEQSLNELLPGQSEPWLIKVGDDVAGYVNTETFDEREGGHTVTVDMSGRHYNRDQEILYFLSELQKRVGGKVINDV